MMSDNQQISQKIHLLFEYRKIHWLLAQSAIKDHLTFREQLINLQLAIYELDWHLENNWNIELPDLKTFWLNIYKRLAEMGLSDNQQRTWTKEIERYQARELDLRKGISPLRHSMEDLYNFKSCDVRLMRRLIYRADDSLNMILRFSEWLEFDLITEVNDDIEDVFEDLGAFNANRFLFSFYELGASATHERFDSFINEKWKSIDQKIETSDTKSRLHMKTWIKDVMHDTLILLKDRLANLSVAQINAAEVILQFEKARSSPGTSN